SDFRGTRRKRRLHPDVTDEAAGVRDTLPDLAKNTGETRIADEVSIQTEVNQSLPQLIHHRQGIKLCFHLSSKAMRSRHAESTSVRNASSLMATSMFPRS